MSWYFYLVGGCDLVYIKIIAILSIELFEATNVFDWFANGWSLRNEK